MLLSITTMFISCHILSIVTGNEYEYGEHIMGYRWSGTGNILSSYNSISSASACETKCKNWSGSTDCSVWAFKSSNGKCIIGAEAAITADSSWTAGFNKNICDDALDCNQNSVCSSWNNEAFSVSGGKRTLSTTGGTRCYYSYIPNSCKNNPTSKCKVVINFGGIAKNAIPWANDRIDLTERITGEASNGWSTPGIVIYPQKYAVAGGWQYHPGRSGMCTGHDDIEFVADILADLETNNIHWDGVYAVGKGNGGHFVFDLPYHLENDYNIIVKAIGSYSGNSLTDHGGSVEKPLTPLHLLIVQGYNDETHDYWGHTTTGCDMGKDDSQSLADWWGDALNCDVNPTIDDCWSGTAPNCNGQNGEKERHYTNCDNNVDVILKSTNTGYDWTGAGDVIFPDFFNDH